MALSQQQIIGLGVGIPGVAILIGVCIVIGYFCYKKHKKRKSKRGGQQPYPMPSQNNSHYPILPHLLDNGAHPTSNKLNFNIDGPVFLPGVHSRNHVDDSRGASRGLYGFSQMIPPMTGGALNTTMTTRVSNNSNNDSQKSSQHMFPSNKSSLNTTLAASALADNSSDSAGNNGPIHSQTNSSSKLPLYSGNADYMKRRRSSAEAMPVYRRSSTHNDYPIGKINPAYIATEDDEETFSAKYSPFTFLSNEIGGFPNIISNDSVPTSVTRHNSTGYLGKPTSLFRKHQEDDQFHFQQSNVYLSTPALDSIHSFRPRSFSPPAGFPMSTPLAQWDEHPSNFRSNTQASPVTVQEQRRQLPPTPQRGGFTRYELKSSNDEEFSVLPKNTASNDPPKSHHYTRAHQGHPHISRLPRVSLTPSEGDKSIASDIYQVEGRFVASQAFDFLDDYGDDVIDNSDSERF